MDEIIYDTIMYYVGLLSSLRIPDIIFRRVFSYVKNSIILIPIIHEFVLITQNVPAIMIDTHTTVISTTS